MAVQLIFVCNIIACPTYIPQCTRTIDETLGCPFVVAATKHAAHTPQ